MVGGGISGLASAYLLAKGGVKVVLYEKEDRWEVHAKTVNVDGVDVDLGFMVFNWVSIAMVFFFFFFFCSDDSILEQNINTNGGCKVFVRED